MHCSPYGEMVMQALQDVSIYIVVDFLNETRIPLSNYCRGQSYDNVSNNAFMHSFILAISIAPLQVLYYSGALPTTARILYWSFTPKRTCRQLQVKDLPRVPIRGG